VAARLVLALICIAVVIGLSLRLADHEACESARKDLFAAVAGKADRSGAAEQVETIEDRCRGTEPLIAAAGALRTLGDRAEALRLARLATDREPESFAAWRARAVLASGREAREAAMRALELNPRWSPPPALA
jgi:hypothetical protein